MLIGQAASGLRDTEERFEDLVLLTANMFVTVKVGRTQALRAAWSCPEPAELEVGARAPVVSMLRAGDLGATLR